MCSQGIGELPGDEFGYGVVMSKDGGSCQRWQFHHSLDSCRVGTAHLWLYGFCSIIDNPPSESVEHLNGDRVGLSTLTEQGDCVCSDSSRS